MKLPIRYSFRNLSRRKMRTALTVVAVSLVVGISVVMFAFTRGILRTAKDSGSPDNIILVDRKAATQTFSKISSKDYALLKSLPQIKCDSAGEPLISPEALQQSRVTVGEQKNRPGTIRGVTPRVFEVNTKLHMVEGEKPKTGRGVIVGDLAHTALGVPREMLDIGRELEFQNETWKVVGRFEAGGTALDSEILADLSDIMAVYARDSYSTALVKLEHAGEVALVIHALNNRNDIQVKAVTETEYYRSLAEGYERIIFLAVAMSLIALIGGLVSGMNTMYASVLGRIREIGTLKVMGFGSRHIIGSFVVESVMISIMGAVIGCSVSWLANGISTKFASGAFVITVDAWAMLAGACVALVIGVLGALPPAFKGTRMSMTAALQYG